MTQFSRREILQWAVASGLLQLTGCSGRGLRSGKPPANARVVVVGGGFAGMTAARAVKESAPGLSVTLVERNKIYVACPGSNRVIADLRRPRDQRHGYKGLKARGIDLVTAEAAGIDSRGRAVVLADGGRLAYDRLIVSPGIDFLWGAIEGYDEAASRTVPHAWRGGPQTTLLKRQLRAMRDGGVVVITVPANPYRCPPGPYERASLIAHFLSENKPRSKVVILDSKTQFSKQALFQKAWKELYPGMVEWVSAEKEGAIERVDAARKTVHTHFNDYRADVLNVIPPQRAGDLARQAGLVDESGWCPVNFRSFESLRVPGIHVVGDAAKADPMPKSAFAANVQARACALAVVDLLAGQEPEAPRLINNCYSFVDPDLAISVTGVYSVSGDGRNLSALTVAETAPGADWRKEGELAMDWEQQFVQDIFS